MYGYSGVIRGYNELHAVILVIKKGIPMDEMYEDSLELTGIDFPLKNENEKISYVLNLNYTGNQYQTIKNFLNIGQYYEPDVSMFLKKIISAGDTCIDIGANVGFHTSLMAACSGKNGKIIAVEPFQENCERINEMKEINDFHNIDIFNYALSNKSGEEYYFCSSPKDTGWSYICRELKETKTSEEYFDHESIETKSLLDLITVDENVKVVKLDVEGSEQIILDGCIEKIVNKSVDFWVVECADHCLARHNSSQHSLRNLFYGHDVETFVLRGDGHMPVYVPPNMTLSYDVIPNLCFTTFEKLEEYYKSVECGNLARTFSLNKN